MVMVCLCATTLPYGLRCHAAIVGILVELQKTLDSKTILSKKNGAGGITIQYVKIYYKVMVTKTTRSLHKNTYVVQWDKREHSHTVHTTSAHLIFGKMPFGICWRKAKTFNKQCWENWMDTFRRLKLDPQLSLCIYQLQM